MFARFYNYMCSRSIRFTPPLFGSVLQWLKGDEESLNGTENKLIDSSGNDNYGLRKITPEVVPAGNGDRAVGSFDGADDLNFEISKSIYNNDDWCLKINGYFYPTEPYNTVYLDGAGVTDYNILIHRQNLDDYLSIILDNNAGFLGGSIPVYDSGYHELEFYYNKQTGAFTWFVDGNEEASGNISEFTIIPSIVKIGARFSSSRETQAVITTVNFCDETFELNAGSGSTITGSEGTLASISDETPETFWANDVVRKINIDPNGALETALGLSAGTLNKFCDRSELDALFDPMQLTTIKNDQKEAKPVSLVYGVYPDLTPAESIAILNYFRRFGYTAAVDSNGDLATDSNGDYAIAPPEGA